MNENETIITIILAIVLFIVGYRLGRSNSDDIEDIDNNIFSLNVTIILSFIIAIIWGAGNIQNILMYPLSNLLKCAIYGILLSCISGCIYVLLPYELKPLVPILLFCSIIYSLINFGFLSS